MQCQQPNSLERDKSFLEGLVQPSLLNIYSSLLLIVFTPRENVCLSWFTLHESIAHWKPIRSSSQQSRRNRRFCVRTEALSFMIFVAAQKLSREAWTISLGKKIHIGETTRNDEWQDVSNQAAGHFNRQNWHSRQNMAIPRRQKSHKILGWKLFSFRARHSKPAWMNERFSSIIFAEVVKRKILQCVWSLAHT